MFSRVTPLVRTATRSLARPVARPATRGMVTIEEALTAEDARKISCYSEIDYAVSENAPVLDAVQKFAAFNIGCLVTTDEAGMFRFISLLHLFMILKH